MGDDDGEARVDVYGVDRDVEGLGFAVGDLEGKTAVEVKTALITRALEETGMGRYQWCMCVVPSLLQPGLKLTARADSSSAASATRSTSCGPRPSRSSRPVSSRSSACRTSSTATYSRVRVFLCRLRACYLAPLRPCMSLRLSLKSRPYRYAYTCAAILPVHTADTSSYSLLGGPHRRRLHLGHPRRHHRPPLGLQPHRRDRRRLWYVQRPHIFALAIHKLTRRVCWQA